jgi:hypothetical protein
MPEAERKPEPGVRQLDNAITALFCFIAIAVPIIFVFSKFGNADWPGLQWQDWFKEVSRWVAAKSLQTSSSSPS